MIFTTERYLNSKITYYKNMYEHKNFVFVLEFDKEDDDEDDLWRSMITQNY